MPITQSNFVAAVQQVIHTTCPAPPGVEVVVAATIGGGTITASTSISGANYSGQAAFTFAEIAAVNFFTFTDLVRSRLKTALVSMARAMLLIQSSDESANPTVLEPPPSHAASHRAGGNDVAALDAAQVTTGTFVMARLASGTPTGSKFIRDDGTLQTPPGGGGAATPYTAFAKDLGTSKRSGTFDLTGLSGLEIDKLVSIVQTAAPIVSKGNARDEPEMDLIRLTGYVVNATTIRAYWQADGVVVGPYEFAYLVSA